MDIPSFGHDPVLVREVLDALDPRPGQVVLDCTLGRAGHAWIIAQRLGQDGLLLGCDVDNHNLKFAQERLAAAPCRVRLFHASFAEADDVLRTAGVGAVDAVLADLGLSTNQLFDSRYGLSFAQPMPLDMRIDPRLTQTAADLVNTMREADLADVLYELAQERYSRRIARKITDARRVEPITTTDRLADLVRSAIPRRGGWKQEKIDPATRTFLALRMAVNREVENLTALLRLAPHLLVSGGKIGIISFQSTEDRLVKQGLRSAEQANLLTPLTRKPITPADDELAANPRSRSAKLRAAAKP